MIHRRVVSTENTFSWLFMLAADGYGMGIRVKNVFS